MDGENWSWIIDPLDYYNGSKLFNGNDGYNTEKYNDLENITQPLLAQYIRLYPVTWSGHISLRFDVHACIYFDEAYMCNCSAATTPGTWTHEGEDEMSSCMESVCSQQVNGAALQCQNGGSCRDDGGEETGWMFCDCTPGFTGPYCDIVDACQMDVVCSGRSAEETVCNSTVTSFSTDTGDYQHAFSCECDTTEELVTYSGDLCDVASCNGTFTCYNGGSCHESLLCCSCPYPFTGVTCEEIEYCLDIDCMHGECSETETGFLCTCHPDSEWSMNTDTGLCTTFVCGSSNSICMNEAQCSADMDDPEDENALCQCRNYNLEDNCQLETDCGPDNNCYGRGTCTDGVCSCNNRRNDPDRYTENNCGTETCRNGEQCLNGGSCRGRGNRCSCVFPYLEGDRCEVQNWCLGTARRANRNPNCINGDCMSQESGWLPPDTDVTGGYNCSCDDGWQVDGALIVEKYRYHCTTRVCPETGLLCHNLGKCKRSGRVCKCKNKYSGDNCENLASESSSSNDNTRSSSLPAALGGGAGAAGAAGTAATALGAWRRRRNQQQQQAQSREAEDISIKSFDECEDANNGAAPAPTNGPGILGV